MQTNFTPAQLADPAIAEADRILRACVHCGFCTATCPTFVLTGDENDSPRGRIYLIKDMLEKGRPASDKVALHIDRCLSCLSCMTTCPSGVHYMHLVDHARAYVEKTRRRPLPDRMVRALLARVLPSPGLFRVALKGAKLARPLAPMLPAPLRAMLDLAPERTDPATPPGVFPAEGPVRMRVALLAGCVQQVVADRINQATIRLLNRHGAEVVVVGGSGCCGALPHHMGREEQAKSLARANVEAWWAEKQARGLDHVVINASGCGTTVKDYGHMLPEDPRAAELGAMTRDITEIMAALGLKPAVAGRGVAVAYHSACSLQHGQKVREQPKRLLAEAGFDVREIAEAHLCCGSAGTYNILQPDFATRLRDRKVANIEATAPRVIAAGNIGCMMQIGSGTTIPVVHTAELLDWATGGPNPLPMG